MKNTGWIIFHSFCAGMQFALFVVALRDGNDWLSLLTLIFLVHAILFVVLNCTVFQKARISR